LLRGDGTLLSRTPINEKLLGQKFAGSRIFDSGEDKYKGIYIGDSRASDGIKRIVSYEYLNEFDVYVVVTRGYEESLTSFYLARFYAYVCISILSVLILAAAVVIHRAQRVLLRMQQHYQKLALVDDLTAVPNRRAFMGKAEDALEMARLHGGQFALLMLDIDHFKNINDRFGHAMGDEVLKSVAVLWRGALRRDDILGRIGGEEFCVVLPGADGLLAVDTVHLVNGYWHNSDRKAYGSLELQSTDARACALPHTWRPSGAYRGPAGVRKTP